MMDSEAQHGQLRGGEAGVDDDLNTPLLSDDHSQAPVAQDVRKISQFLAVLSATCGAFCLGSVLAWTSPVGERLKQGALGFPISDDQLGWVGSLAGFGAAVMAPIAGQLVDRLGRKACMIFLCVPLCIGWLLVAFAKNPAMLYSGRIICGASGGAFSVAAPVYVSEVAHPSLRGALGALFQLQVVMGVEMAYVIGPLVSVFWLTVISAILPVVTAVAVLIFSPESPSFLLRKGRTNAAHDSLQWLWGNKCDLRTELNEMSRQVSEERSVSVKTIFLQKATMICVGLMAFQQFSGINAVIFFTEQIFAAAGGSVQGATAAAIVGAVQVGATFLSFLVVDKAGRRPLLLLSATVMAACNTTLGAFFFLKDRGQDLSSLGMLPVLAVCLYFLVFSLGFGPVPWIMVGELFAPEVKGVAGSVASAATWWLAFAVTSLFRPIVSAIGEGQTFWMFAGLTAVGVLFVLLFVPETKGKTLEEIQTSLNATN
ncbi:facilitated trehalose transporter Tret1-like [Cloeon dipterum]|uniref:facilitated trehalose transporter Tret1-like n=1 Tax=Cloeon dipterum TaxID=197152 RepID=UPI00322001AD